MRRDVEALCARPDDVGSLLGEEAQLALRRDVARLERLEDRNAAAEAVGWSAMHRIGWEANRREIRAIQAKWRIQ